VRAHDADPEAAGCGVYLDSCARSLVIEAIVWSAASSPADA